MQISWPYTWPHMPMRHCMAHMPNSSHANILHQVGVAKRSGQEVTSSGAGVHYVEDVRKPDGRTHEVLLEKHQCCDHVVMNQQPCRHMVCVFHKQGMLSTSERRTRATINNFWPKCFHSDNYLNMYKDKIIRQPEVYTGKYVGPDEFRVGKPYQPPIKRGRPKTKRYQWKRRTVKDLRGPVTHEYYQDVLTFF